MYLTRELNILNGVLYILASNKFYVQCSTSKLKFFNHVINILTISIFYVQCSTRELTIFNFVIRGKASTSLTIRGFSM